MGFNCGIVGLPNVGKSTIFNALTRAGAESSNYPFTTIEPNVGVVSVPDSRLDNISELMPAKKVVFTNMRFVDIAGLVKGASKGEGLGNKFLGHIREVRAIAHVVRCFDDDNITHVHGKVDPISDIEIIETELAIADLEALQKRKLKIDKLARSGDKDAKFEVKCLAELIETLNSNKPTRSLSLESEAEIEFVQSLNLITSKPVLYVCNTIDPSESDNEHVKKIQELAASEGAETVSISGKLEGEIMEIEDPDECQAFLEEMDLEEPGLNRVIRAGYDLLGLATFFTAGGGKENRAWTIKKNAKAPQAAGAIHTDFEKGFIRAQVYHYEDLVKLKSENAVKEAGLLRSEGKEYDVKDGDIIEFLFNV
jgi:GTP-binding protein YchF